MLWLSIKRDRFFGGKGFWLQLALLSGMGTKPLRDKSDAILNLTNGFYFGA